MCPSRLRPCLTAALSPQTEGPAFVRRPPRAWRHQLRVGAVSDRHLGHSLFLHVEGSQIHRQGKGVLCPSPHTHVTGHWCSCAGGKEGGCCLVSAASVRPPVQDRQHAARWQTGLGSALISLLRLIGMAEGVLPSEP